MCSYTAELFHRGVARRVDYGKVRVCQDELEPPTYIYIYMCTPEAALNRTLKTPNPSPCILPTAPNILNRSIGAYHQRLCKQEKDNVFNCHNLVARV